MKLTPAMLLLLILFYPSVAISVDLDNCVTVPNSECGAKPEQMILCMRCNSPPIIEEIWANGDLIWEPPKAAERDAK